MFTAGRQGSVYGPRRRPATDVREGLQAEFEWVLEHSRERRGAVAASG
jgi:hypothetical protein